ncbi:uncharacterized protein PFLUO_LOCUS4736 [Penicillium psychrofluorescens]|uniref:uncharacterized protein n=1 Tax=Penicillium psychrofluorescens TaxID=3158075 RepID=UPI003CCD0690
MPTSGTSSPVKRPGLGRRAVSSYAVVTRTANPNDLSGSHTTLKQPVHHKQHRTHVVGGGHRNHNRNPSFGKLNKLQRLASQVSLETTGRHHQRKKSAPATPVASPKGHIQWDGALDDPQPAQSMKRNYSTPALRRNSSGLAKKALTTSSRPHSSTGKKKTVGFELGDVDNDDAEWEDTTQSPQSTRRGSVAPSILSVDNAAVLVDPLTFVKRPYPQMPRATSLPESITSKLARESHDADEDDYSGNDSADDEAHDESDPHAEHGDIASRLLSPSHSAKAPPAMSSISATAKPSATDPASSRESLNLAGQDGGARRTFSMSNMGIASMPGSHPPATASSIEGGVSKFIVNNKSGIHSTSRTDSDPNTPSSFLPHYHPQTPPSPSNRSLSKSAVSPARLRDADPPSRTQQKLWLQRTATLNNSPPDSHGVPTPGSQSTMDPAFMTPGHSRPGSVVTFDTSRSGMNGGGRVGGAAHDSEARHVRKAYEKTSLELMVVRRFQSPTGDSFGRLRSIARTSKSPTVIGAGRVSGLGKPVKSAPSLTLLQHGKRPGRLSSSPDSKLTSPNPTSSEEQATNSESTDTTQVANSSHPSHRLLSTSDEAAHGLSAGENDPEDEFQVSESDMMVRRMWESREVATSG